MNQRILGCRQTPVENWSVVRIRRIITNQAEWPAAARNLIPLSRFPQGASRGGDGSPHAAAHSAPAKNAGTAPAAAPPARGVSKRFAETPLARSPRIGLSRCPAAWWLATGEDDRMQKKIKEGRHVGLDFYDLLIEDDKVCNRLIKSDISTRRLRATSRAKLPYSQAI
jgi:hypothetical protein